MMDDTCEKCGAVRGRRCDSVVHVATEVETAADNIVAELDSIDGHLHQIVELLSALVANNKPGTER